GMPADVEMPAPVNTAIFLLIPQEYHAVMSVCGGLLGATRRVFGVVLVFGWLVCVFWCVVCGVFDTPVFACVL
ncbi:hypothetical protein, partial [Bifidobacterium thermophilum]|uniref:hypothetical protein n=1 Tax=Bifidobacterium thermophilum TaxID=33905 RepID=UPI001C596CE7